jgi:LDH2 family malate/lactate/ureidoglycolate dehydrogenase/aryl carrier-like protein
MELREFLKWKLPDYMVPSAIMGLGTLPLTPNGKVDRKALSVLLVSHETEAAQAEPATTFAAPHTPAGKTLATIWKELLSLNQVGVEDNFFDLGGDSLLAIQMINRANQAGLQISVRQLFQHQTIAELARVAAPHAVPGKSESVVGSNQKTGAARRDRGLMVEHKESPSSLPPRPSAVANEGEAPVRVTVESLRAYGREALERAGLSAEGAAIVTEVQIEASLRGQPTHGMDSIPRYARRIASGAINPRPQIRIERETAINAQLDGDNGPGQWVSVVAMETAIRKAREKGIAIVGAHRSNHFGAAGHYAWLAAREGLIGLCTTNGRVILAPTGGLTPTFGNNPLGVGIPAEHHHPILLDIAMSVAPRGKIGLQLAEGKPLPPGWILDRGGRPSIDPADLAAGLGVPIGGHKGYGLALIMEVLAGALTGAGFCSDHRREEMRQGTEPPDVGHFFMAIDPEIFMPLAEFTVRVDQMIEQTKAGEKVEGVEEILIPGEVELRARAENIQKGVPLRAVTYRALQRYGEGAGVNTELVLVP